MPSRTPTLSTAVYLLSTLIDTWLLYPLITGLKDGRQALAWPRWGRTLGLMIKLKDDLSGSIDTERDISKPFTPADQAKLDRAFTVARRTHVKSGADDRSIFMTPMRGTHPCACVRLSDALDFNLQTQIENLYVCDASDFPEALARPTVLRIIGLAKRLVEHLQPGAPALMSEDV